MKTLLLLSLMIFQVRSTCPPQCNCTDTAILCAEQSLMQIPSLKHIETVPSIVDLSGNHLVYLDQAAFSFPKCADVKELFLNSSELAFLETTVFDRLENLQELYLGDNVLNELPELIIDNLEDIILLELSKNHFTNGMPVIRSESLEVLSLANSKISVISKNALKYLPNLKLLLLQQNDLTTVSMNVFENAPLTSLFLKLSYNPWTCDCDNMAVFQMLLEKNFIDLSDPYQCTEDDTVIDIYGKTGSSFIENYCFPDNNINIMDEYARTLIKSKEENYSDVQNQIIPTENQEINQSQQKVIVDRRNVEACDTISFKQYYFSLVIATVTGFIIGVSAVSVLVCILKINSRKLEQTSESQAQLLST